MEIFPDFGKYSLYVWTSYGLSIAALLSITAYTFIQKYKRK